nr:MAG TPA_asm: hypothetical protein [Caudoviricetes sp.]
MRNSFILSLLKLVSFSTSVKFFVPPNLSVIPQLSASIFPIVNKYFDIVRYVN